VEHPVTEAITGVDLVEWQLRVARGEPLPLSQEDLTIDGWAMEARLYAEDPAKGFLPSIGRLDLLQFGEADGGRIDTGVFEGAEVSPFYDPMIAKVIAWGEDREEARERLGAMLDDTAVWPVRTNAAFLVKALQHPDFAAGKVDTGLIGRDGDGLAAAPVPSAEALRVAAQALVPASLAPGLRLNAAPVRTAWFLLDDEAIEIELDGEGADEPMPGVLVTEQGQAWLLSPWRKDGAHGAAAGSGTIVAPMPGKVIAVEVSAGQAVTKGQKLLTLEAMKMEHTLTAPFDGTVAELNAAAGQQVQVDALLVRIEETA
jgi:3-methylcrotonyl-CoA carboxylase alpha subunit